jgi:hypothetical protein
MHGNVETLPQFTFCLNKLSLQVTLGTHLVSDSEMLNYESLCIHSHRIS